MSISTYALETGSVFTDYFTSTPLGTVLNSLSSNFT
jgi:hypothetical protein